MKADLAREAFLVREDGSGTQAVFEEFMGGIAVSGRASASRWAVNETIKQAVMAGLGVALISGHTVATEVEAGRLALLDVAGLPIRRQWYALRRADRTLGPAAAAFRQFPGRRGRELSAAAAVEDARVAGFGAAGVRGARCHSGAPQASPATVLGVKPEVWVVGLLCFEDGVCGDEDAARDGHQGDLGGLALTALGLIGGPLDGVVADRHEGAHVQGCPHAGPPARDGGARGRGARLADLRGEADQAGDGLAVAPAELGQLGDQDGTDPLADARHRAQQAPGLGARRIAGEAA